jgi:hypothetical protein
MPTQNDILTAVLAAIRPSQVPPEQRVALNEFRQEVREFLQQRFPMHHERVGEPRTIGSTEKGTDIALSYDIDLILPFKYGYRATAQKMKSELLAALKERFPTPPTIVRDQRVSVGLRRPWRDTELGLDIVPGMEKSPGNYSDTSTDEEKKYLVLYDRESNTERTTNIDKQKRLLIQKAEHYRDIVRLLKAWRYKHQKLLPIGSYALELLVYQAATASSAPKTGSLEKLLRYTLQWAIPFLEKDGILQDIGANYPWPDYLKPATKMQLAALWKKLLAALESSDTTQLRSFFP